MAFNSATLDDLRERLKRKAGISDQDPRVLIPSLIVEDDGSTNATATVEVLADSIEFVRATSGTQSLSLTSGNPTLSALVTSINALGDGLTASFIGADADTPAADLAIRAAISIASSPVVLDVISNDGLDAFLQEALSKAETWTRQVLFDDGSTEVEATVWENGDGVIMLPDGHINRLSFLAVDTEEAFRVQYAGAGDASIEITDDAVILSTRALGNPPTITTIDLDESTDVQDIVDSVTAVADWTATIVNDGPSENIVPAATQKVASSQVGQYAWTMADGEYRLDRKAGIVYLDDLTVTAFATSRAGDQARARYRAGFTTLPNDLAEGIINVAKAGLDGATRTSGLASERLGDYSYTASPGSDASAAMDDALAAQERTLGAYRRMTP